MNRLKRKLKRFLLYISAFVAVMTLTAGFKVGVFFITRTDSGGNANNGGNSGTEISESNALTEVLSNIMNIENASFVINLSVVPDGQNEELKILANAKVSLIDEENPDASILEKLKISLSGNIEFFSQKLNFNIDYLNGFIYANIGEAKIRIQTENVKDDLNKILSFATLKKFDINLSLPDFSEISFDPSMISMIASGLTENETSDGKEIKFNLLGYGEIVLITDKDYVLQNVKVDRLEIENTKIEAVVNACLKEVDVNIVEPENKNEFTDFSGMINVLDSVDDFVADGLAQGKINLKAFNQNLVVDYFINFSDFNNVIAKFRTDIGGDDLILAYQNNKIFVSIKDYKYFVETPVNVNKIIESLKFYLGLFGKDIPEIDINELKTKLEALDLGTILNFVNDIKISENSFKFAKQDVSAEILIQDKKLSNLQIAYKEEFGLDISLDEKIDEIDICENKFKNIFDEDVFNLLITSILDNKTLAFDVSVNYKDIDINSVLKVDLSNGRKFQLSVKMLNKNLLITIIEDTIYVEIDKVLKAKGNLSEIVEILKDSDVLKLDAVSQSEIKDFVLSILNGENEKINKILSNVAFNIVKANDKIEAIEIRNKNISCYAKIIEFSAIEFDFAKEYQSLKDLCNFALKLKNVIETKTSVFEIVGSYKDYDLFGKVQYVNGELLLTMQTKILDKDLILDLQDNTIYVDFDGLKVKCELNEIQSLIECLGLTDKIDVSKLKSKLSLDEIFDNLKIEFVETNLKLAFKDMLASIDLNNLKINLNATDLSCEVKFTEQFNKQDKTGYIDLYELKDLIKATLNTLENKSISGKIDVIINLFGEDNHLDINYSIQYENNELKGKIFTNFKGLNIKAYIDNKDIYLDIASIKVHFNIDEIDSIIAWVNNIFETNIEFNLNDTFNVDKLKEIKFDFIKSIQCLENKTIVELTNDLKIEVKFDEYISQIDFIQNNRSATIFCTDFEPISFDNLNKEEYKKYTVFTNLIDSTYKLIKSKQYSIGGEIKKYKNSALSNTINISADVDITNLLNAYVDILGLDEQITVSYENKVLYFCYGGETGLKISIKEKAIQEILSIVCSAFNVDTKSIPYLDEFLSKENIDTGNLSSIMPKVELSNPLSYVEYIEGFEVTDDYFAITLKAEKLGEYAKNKDVVIKLNYSNGKITSLTVDNLYVYGDSDEYINIKLDIKDFVKINSVKDKDKYIDLSDSKDLLRAFVNTTNLNDYHVTGKIKLNINIGINFDAANVGVDAKVKKFKTETTKFDETLGEFVTEEKTELVGMIQLTNYPLIAGVNNSNTNGGVKRNRTITIYFKDGYIYLSTVDDKKSFYDKYERATKVTFKTLKDNLKHYMQYLLGFTDTIQSKINDAIDTSQNYTGKTNYGNIIEEYSHSNNKHTIKINLKELAHNDDIGTLTVVLTTINNAQTKNKDYLYRLDVDMKLLNNILALKTDTSSSSEALFLTDIGNEVSILDAEKFINDYNDAYKLNVDGEYEREGNNNFKQSNTGTSEIRLVNNGEKIKVLTGTIASKVDLPILQANVEDDGVIRQEYMFGGWFVDESLLEEYTSGVFPRYNTTLFAKWIKLDPKVYATINFVTNDENISQDAILGFVGDKLTLPVLANIEKTIDENNSVLKIFKGWKTYDGTLFTKDVIEHSNLTLYAVWEEKITKTYNLKIYSAGSLIYDGKVEANMKFSFPKHECFVESTKYYTTENFVANSLVTSFVVTDHTVWYARNKFQVIIASKYTNISGENYSESLSLYEDETINLTQFTKNPENKGTYTTEYTFKGYTLNDEILIVDATYKMTTKNLNFIAKWEEIDYCYVTFNQYAWKQPAWWTVRSWQKSPINVSGITSSSYTILNGNQIKIQKDTAVDTSKIIATCSCQYGTTGLIKPKPKMYDFEVVAWAEEVQNLYDTAASSQKYSGSTSIVISENKTLMPVWKHV